MKTKRPQLRPPAWVPFLKKKTQKQKTFERRRRSCEKLNGILKVKGIFSISWLHNVQKAPQLWPRSTFVPISKQNSILLDKKWKIACHDFRASVRAINIPFDWFNVFRWKCFPVEVVTLPLMETTETNLSDIVGQNIKGKQLCHVGCSNPTQSAVVEQHWSNIVIG